MLFIPEDQADLALEHEAVERFERNSRGLILAGITVIPRPEATIARTRSSFEERKEKNGRTPCSVKKRLVSESASQWRLTIMMLPARSSTETVFWVAHG